MAKRKITVTTQDNATYDLSYTLTKAFSGNYDGNLVQAKTNLLNTIIIKINEATKLNLNQNDIHSLDIICETNNNISSTINDLGNNFAFLDPLFLDIGGEIQPPQSAILGEFLVDIAIPL